MHARTRIWANHIMTKPWTGTKNIAKQNKKDQQLEDLEDQNSQQPWLI